MRAWRPTLQPARRGPWGGLVLLGMALASAGSLFAVAGSPALPRWDMAKYGAAGSRLADQLATGDLAGFVREVYGFGSWPPGFPLLEVPVFLLWGAGFDTAQRWVAMLFLVALGALGWAALGLDPRRGGAIAGVAGALMVTSPMHQVFATLVMLEVPGTLFLLIAWGAYLRAIRRPGCGWAWHLTGFATLTLIFVKFNYGLLWVVPLGLTELWRRAHSQGGLGAWGRTLLARIDPRHPWTAFVLIYGCGLVLLRVSGGVDVELLGTRLRATSVGNPAYVLYALMLLRAAVRPRRTAAWCRARWLRLDSAGRTLVAWVFFPVAFWMALPPHLKDFFGFVENRDSQLTWIEGVRYYPEVLADLYSAWPWVAALLVPLALLGLGVGWESRRGKIAQVLLFWILVIGALALVAHPYKLPRFAFTWLPALWLAAARGMVLALELVARRVGWGRGREVGSACGVSLALAVALVAMALPVARQRAVWERHQHTVPPEVAVVVAEVVESGRSDSTDEATLVLGTWNLLSPGLLEWWAIQQGIPAAERPVAVRSLGRKASRRFRRATRLVVLEPLADDPAWVEAHHQDTEVEKPVRDQWKSTGEWRRLEEAGLKAAGYQVSLWVRER